MYSDYRDRECRQPGDEVCGLREAALQDLGLPPAFKEVLADDAIWREFQPTGEEIDFIRERIVPLGHGPKSAFCNALQLVRNYHRGSRPPKHPINHARI